MKTIFYHLIILIFSIVNVMSQSFTVIDVDNTNFPSIKSNFLATDANGNQITNFSLSDFEVKENGEQRNILKISCRPPKPIQPLSSVLVIDLSPSMLEGGLDIAKAAAKAWIEMLPVEQSDCAITTFNTTNRLIQDFTNNRAILLNSLNNVASSPGTNYNAAFIDSLAGGILVAKNGNKKRVIVFLSDGEPNSQPNTQQIINQALLNNVTIYCLTIGINAPQCLIDISNQTGGKYFDNLRSAEQATACYRNILMEAQGAEPCTIEWESKSGCKQELVEVDINQNVINLTSSIQYKTALSSVSSLKFYPLSLLFKNIPVGETKDTIIQITAVNTDMNISTINLTNSLFTISPTNFILKKGEKLDFKISYTPIDSNYQFTKIEFIGTPCNYQFDANAFYYSD